jgi:hypothetical protein
VRSRANVIWQNELLIYLGESSTTLEARAHREQHVANESFEMNVVRFRPSNTTAFSEKRAHASSSNIYELLDLSRYELSDRSRNEADSQKDGPDDFEHRMHANVAALIFLVALVGLAAADVLKLAAHIS